MQLLKMLKNSNQKILINGIFEEIGHQKCFWDKSPGKEYSLKLWLKEKRKQRNDWQFSERFWILLSETFGSNLI
jgi:hypothetical protein